MAESGKKSLGASEQRKAAKERLEALKNDEAPSVEALQALYDDLSAYHDSLNERALSMQDAVTELVNGMSETSRNLNETGTRLEAILEAAEDVAFIIVDKDSPNAILEFSSGAERIFRYDREEVLGSTPDMLCPPRETLSEGEQWACDCSDHRRSRVLMQRKSGKSFPARVSTYPLKDTNGEQTATLIIALDVTRQERAERFLRESNERYAALALTVPASIIAFDEKGTITFVNNWHMQVLDRGATRAEFYIGKKVYELPPVLRAGIGDTVKHVLDGVPVSMEDVYFPPFCDREGAWHNVRLSPLIQGGECRGGILILEDITRRKLTELDLKMLIDSSPIALIKAEVTPEGAIIRYLNPEAVNMFGKQALGKPVDAYITSAQEEEQHLDMQGEQCQVHARDGIRHAMRTRHTASDKYEMHAVMDVDELVNAKLVAEEASRAKSDFLANVSHEIRTPLNVLLGMLQLFQDVDLGEDMNEMSVHATGAANSLLALLNDILDFSVVEARALALDEQNFNLREVMELVILPYSMEAANKGLDLRYDIDTNMPRLFFGDARRFRQILFHLLGNAVKFTDTGHVTVEATYLPRSEKDGRAMVAVMVADTGIGMTDEQLETIYTPFHQCDGSRTRRHGGTGIGLALVKEFVAAMNGSITVKSEPGVGTEFVFTVSLGVVPEVR